MKTVTKEECVELAKRLGCTLRIFPTMQDYPDSFSCDLGLPRVHQDRIRAWFARSYYSMESLWRALQFVRVDLLFYRCGLSSGDTLEILKACEGEGEELYADWARDEDPDTGLILADWLCDRGNEMLGNALRSGILALQKHPVVTEGVNS